MSVRFLCQGALLLGLAAGLGCGGAGSLVNVEGVVTLDGKPLEGVTVAFTPDSGRPSVGTTDATGAFKLTTFNTNDGALPGEYKVTVRKDVSGPPGANLDITPTDPTKNDEYAKAMKGFAKKSAPGMPGMKMKSKQASLVPEKYGDLARTPLKFRIPHDGKILIELSSK